MPKQTTAQLDWLDEPENEVAYAAYREDVDATLLSKDLRAVVSHGRAQGVSMIGLIKGVCAFFGCDGSEGRRWVLETLDAAGKE